MEQVIDNRTLGEVEVEERAAALRSDSKRLFKWSAFLHVGEGADECAKVDESTFTNECDEPGHFHAWIRLPNDLQHKDIREKAMAAKARRRRLLKDPESDGHAILEDRLDDLRRAGDSEAIIADLIQPTWATDFLEATREVEAEEEYKLVAQDRERLAEIQDMPLEEQPVEERDELSRHLSRYVEAINARFKEIQEPRKDALRGLSRDELIAQYREREIEREAEDEWAHTYGVWTWLVGTMRIHKGSLARPDERIFASMAEMTNMPEEVLRALEEQFNDLERAMAGATEGNS